MSNEQHTPRSFGDKVLAALSTNNVDQVRTPANVLADVTELVESALSQKDLEREDAKDEPSIEDKVLANLEADDLTAAVHE